MDFILLVIAVALTAFTLEMIRVYRETGAIPDTLVACVFTALGGECGAMAQGSYTIDRAHPLLQQYNAMVKNYNATIKQLGESLPPIEAEQAGQALMMFATKPTQAAKKA